MFLTRLDLIELTGRRRHDAQAAALNKMGIVHKIRADGMPMVLQSHIDKEFAGASPAKATRRVEPNWGAVNAPQA